jgi:hypothetical protein
VCVVAVLLSNLYLAFAYLLTFGMVRSRVTRDTHTIHSKSKVILYTPCTNHDGATYPHCAQSASAPLRE